jgi:hypothetical protein
MLASSMLERWFESRSGQIKDNEIGIFVPFLSLQHYEEQRLVCL